MDQSIIYPLPDDTVLSEKEGKWRINLPETYKEFVKKNSTVSRNIMGRCTSDYGNVLL